MTTAFICIQCHAPIDKMPAGQTPPYYYCHSCLEKYAEVLKARNRPKSILDNVPVDDKAFPLRKPSPQEPLVVVGQCPTCSNPIYGKESITSGEDPSVRRTCKCQEWLGKRRTT